MDRASFAWRNPGRSPTLSEQRLQRSPDADVFAKAIAESRIILTFDLDFGDILALSGNAVPVGGWRLESRL